MGRLGFIGFTPLLPGSVVLASLSLDFTVGKRRKISPISWVCGKGQIKINGHHMWSLSRGR